MVEYANGLVMLEGDKRMKEATKLYEDAAACEPLDAMERLDVEMAKAEPATERRGRQCPGGVPRRSGVREGPVSPRAKGERTEAILDRAASLEARPHFDVSRFPRILGATLRTLDGVRSRFFEAAGDRHPGVYQPLRNAAPT